MTECSASDASRPKATPAAASFIPWPTTSFSTSPGQPLGPFGLCELEIVPHVQCEVVEDVILFPVIQEIMRIHGELWKCRKGGEDPDQPIRLAVRKRFEQHAVDDAENGAVGADPQSNGQHGDDGKTGAVLERSETVADVLQKAHEA